MRKKCICVRTNLEIAKKTYSHTHTRTYHINAFENKLIACREWWSEWSDFSETQFRAFLMRWLSRMQSTWHWSLRVTLRDKWTYLNYFIFGLPLSCHFSHCLIIWFSSVLFVVVWFWEIFSKRFFYDYEKNHHSNYHFTFTFLHIVCIINISVHTIKLSSISDTS